MSTPADTSNAAPGILAARAGWPLLGGITGALLLASLGVYHETVLELYRFWERTESYSHAFLLVPIALYYIWERRGAAARRRPSPWPLGVFGLLALSLAWAAGRLVDVQIVQQLAVMGLLAVLAGTLLGWRVARVFWFSWVYVMFAVPVWSELVPILQDGTANAAARSLQTLGVPVFHEGHYLTIPNGQFVVADVCAGLRFLLATMSIAALYGYLNFDTPWRAVLVFTVAIVSSIVFNWIRVDIIILAGHFGGMDHSLVDRHTWLGWVLFAVALGPMFLAGHLLREPLPPEEDAAPAGETVPPPSPVRVAAVVIAAIAAVGAGPILVNQIEQRRTAEMTVDIAAPAGVEGWEGPIAPDRGPRPLFPGAHGTLDAAYLGDGVVASVYVGHYLFQSQGRELVHNRNLLASTDDGWYERERSRRVVTSGALAPLPVMEVVLDSPYRERYLLWRWFEVSGVAVSDGYRAKLAQLHGVLRGDEGASVITVAVPMEGARESARDTLTRFVASMGPALSTAAKSGNAGGG